MLSIIPERDVRLFHEDDSGQSAYLCPSPVFDRDVRHFIVLPCQVWFDTEAPEAFKRDNLSEVSTTVEQSVRSEVRIESTREISANSKLLNTSAGTQKVE